MPLLAHIQVAMCVLPQVQGEFSILWQIVCKGKGFSCLFLSYANLAFMSCVSEDKMWRTYVWITLKRPSGFNFDKSQAEEQVVEILICWVSWNTELYKSHQKSLVIKCWTLYDSYKTLVLSTIENKTKSLSSQLQNSDILYSQRYLLKGSVSSSLFFRNSCSSHHQQQPKSKFKNSIPQHSYWVGSPCFIYLFLRMRCRRNTGEKKVWGTFGGSVLDGPHPTPLSVLQPAQKGLHV